MWHISVNLITVGVLDLNIESPVSDKYFFLKENTQGVTNCGTSKLYESKITRR